MRTAGGPVRTLVVWCPDWPLVACGLAARPAAIIAVNRVLAASAPAREEGVRIGQRRREAESRCPGLVVLAEDASRDARAFEAVVASVAEFAPLVEVSVPGTCSLPARGPARYFGGEGPLASRLTEAVGERVSEIAAGLGGAAPDPPCRIGIADGPFGAALAARQSLVVPRGGAPRFLAPYPVEALGRPELASLLRRLGVATLGDFAALPEGAVSARFGADGAIAHRLAQGMDERPLRLAEVPEQHVWSREIDPPAERVDTLAFSAAALADELCERLALLGLAPTRLIIELETDHAETHRRLWRSEAPFRSRSIVDRVRWQLEGWMAGQGASPPSAGVAVLRLVADEVVRRGGIQDGLFGAADAEAERRAERGLARVQGLLGHEGVLMAVLGGGRGPGEQVRLVPYGEPHSAPAQQAPWPGRLPAPAPALVHVPPVPVELLDDGGLLVSVDARGQCSAPPLVLRRPDGRLAQVEAWAGPWPVDERWWDGPAHRRRARLQVLLAAGEAHLLVLERGFWAIEASYD